MKIEGRFQDVIKVDDSTYIADFAVSTEVPLSFLEIEVTLDNECTTIAYIVLDSKSRRSMNIKAGISTDGKTGIGKFYNADLDKPPKSIEVTDDFVRVLRVVIEVDTECFESKSFRLEAKIKAQVDDDKQSDVLQDDININNDDPIVPEYPLPGTIPRPPAGRPKIGPRDIREPTFAKLSQHTIFTSKREDEDDITTTEDEEDLQFYWMIFQDIVDDNNIRGNPWEMVRLEVWGPDNGKKAHIYHMNVKKLRFKLGKKWNLKKYRLRAFIISNWEKDKTYRAEIEWFGSRGKIGKTYTTSVDSPVTIDNGITDIKDKEIRLKRNDYGKTNGTGKLGPSNPNKAGNLPDGFTDLGAENY
jgi:hypothetical protein